MQTNQIVKTEENAGVVAIRHTGIPSLKVQISPEGSGKYSAFASSEGVALLYFEGKTYANQKTAERAAIRYLEDRAAKHVPAQKVRAFEASTSDDVLQHSTPPAGFSW